MKDKAESLFLEGLNPHLSPRKNPKKEKEDNAVLWKCRVCESVSGCETVISRNMRDSNIEKFSYNLCNSCGSLSINRIPSDLAKYYEGYYSFGPIKTSERLVDKIAKLIISKNFGLLKKMAYSFLNSSSDLALKAINFATLNEKSKILDVGCGTGQLVFDIKNLGFRNVLGIDPFLEASLEYNNGSKVLNKSIFDIEGNWDLVMLHHVFEHMELQQETLSKLESLVNEQGLILIRIPNVDSYAFRKFRENWYGIQAPVHLSLPSFKAMKQMVSQAGLKIIDVKGENLMEFWYHSIAYSLNLWDFSEFGIRTHMKNFSLKKRPKIISRKEKKQLESLNKTILNTPQLCDWICYYIKRDRRR